VQVTSCLPKISTFSSLIRKILNGCSSTCRKRRVKCDETRPICQNCIRVNRQCKFVEKHNAASRLRRPDTCAIIRPRTISEFSLSPAYDQGDLGVLNCGGIPTPEDEPLSVGCPETSDHGLSSDNLFLDDSLFSFENVSLPNFDITEWYDLLAEDAINNLDEHKHKDHWKYDFESLSTRQIPQPSVSGDPCLILHHNGDRHIHDGPNASVQPWNSHARIELEKEELQFFTHYIDFVAPILDLFDPLAHFAKVVPDLAFSNRGLLNSLLAVGACHLSLWKPCEPVSEAGPEQVPNSPTADFCGPSRTTRAASHYYHETLRYLSRNIEHADYRQSDEILATAVMVSTYGMFDSKSDYSNWDRHLRRAFWIQRDSGVSGESPNSLQRAVWCAWLRQDIWAAFCTGRPTLTLHQPNTPLASLSPDALHQRIIYLTAKCVQYAATPKKGNIVAYIEAGETLMRMLDAWKQILPFSFQPVPIVASTESGQGLPVDKNRILPVWIHPPANAAAMQLYHFARILTVLTQPSVGGLNTYRARSRLLRESASAICGIAVAQQTQNLPNAFVSFQAVHASKLHPLS
jgi:hypothetical protein